MRRAGRKINIYQLLIEFIIYCKLENKREGCYTPQNAPFQKQPRPAPKPLRLGATMLHEHDVALHVRGYVESSSR